MDGATKSLNLFDEKGEMLSTFDVLKGISEDWDEMSNAEQQAISIALAGKNQFEVLGATLLNFDQAIKASETALMSYGSAARENAKYIDSVQGSIANFKSSFEQLANSIMSGDTLKNIINLGAGILDFANTDLGQAALKITAFIAVWRGLAYLTTTDIGEFMVNDFKKVGAVLKTLPNAARNVSSAFKIGLGTALKNTSTNASALTIVLNGLRGGFSGVGAAAAGFLSTLNPLALGLTTLVSAGYAVYKIATKDRDALENQKQTVSSYQEALDSLNTEYKELSSASNLSATDQQRLKYLEAQIKANQVLLEQEAKKQYAMQFGPDSRKESARGDVLFHDTGYNELNDDLDTMNRLMKDIAEKKQEIANLDEKTPNYAKEVERLTKEEQALEEELAELAETALASASEFYDLTNQMGETTPEMDRLKEKALQTSEAYGAMAENAEIASGAAKVVVDAFNEQNEMMQGANDALSKYQDALASPPEDTAFRQYSEALKKINQMFAEGTTRGKDFWATAELLKGRDHLNEIGWDAKVLQQELTTTNQLFGDAESYGINLIPVLQGIADSSGNITDEFGNVIATIQQTKEGFDFDIPNQNLETLATKLGMTKEMLVALLSAMSLKGDINLLDVDDVIKQIEELGNVADEAGNKAISLNKFKEMTNSLDPYQVAVMRQELEEAGYSFVNLDGDIQGSIDTLKKFNIAVENADGKIEIDTTSLVIFLEQLGFTETEINGFLSRLQEVNNVKLTGLEASLNTARTAAMNLLDTMKGAFNKVFKKTGDTSVDTSKSIKKSSDEMETLNKKKTTAVTGQMNNLKTATNGVQDAVRSLNNALNNLTSKIYTVNIKQNVSTSSSAKSPVGSSVGSFAGQLSNFLKNNVYSKAEGTDDFEGGLALVGDEKSIDGKPRPEMVIANGKARVVGADGPELIKLPKGAQVLPFSDTKKILEGNKRIFGSFPAFAGGTISYGTVNKYTGSSTGTSSSSNKGSSSSGKKKTSSSSSTSTAKAVEKENEAIKKQNELFREEIEILEHQLFLRQKNGATAQEQEKLMKKIQERLHEQANWYRSQGLAETHEYIRETQKQHWEVAEDIKELWENVYEDISDKLDEQLDQTEHKAFLLEKQDKTQQQRIQLYKEAQAKIHATAEKYRKMGLDDNSEYIRELQQQWWDYADKIEEVYDEIRDVIQGQIEDLETTFNYITKKIQLEISNLETEKDNLNQKYSERIQALRKQNEELEKQKELEDALNNLAKVRSKKNLVLKDGFFQYVQDYEEIADAVDKVEEINRKNELEEQIEALEKERDQELAIIDEKIEKYKQLEKAWGSVVDNYQDEQDRLIAEQILGIKLDGQNWDKFLEQQLSGIEREGDNWNIRLDQLDKFIKEYNDKMDSLKNDSFKDDIGSVVYPDSKTVAVKKGGSGPAGLNVGDRVATSDGTYQITKVNDDGSYESIKIDNKKYEGPRSTDDNYVIINPDGSYYYQYGDDDGDYDDPIDEPPPKPKNTYAVKHGGDAPKGLQVGDRIATEGGTFEITKVNDDGSYESYKVDNRVYTGSLRSTDWNPVVIPGYAIGTKDAIGGFSLVGENGPELRALNPGDAIFPNSMVDNLMSWGTLDPSAFFKLAGNNTSNIHNFYIEDISLPGIQDAQQFVRELKNNFTAQAIQYGAR